jgi:RNA polymerase sigma-70 factor (ECF subfamily)
MKNAPETAGEDGELAGRNKVLSRLARTYDRALGRFFERRVRVKADVPDLVQEVFLRLSRMDDPAAIEKPEHFLFVTAANVLRDRARREMAQRRAVGDDALIPVAEGSDFPPDRVLESKQAAEYLAAALRDLPERTRDIFVLRVFEGMKMADVARAFSISTRAAEKHQAKALAHVARVLEDWRHR